MIISYIVIPCIYISNIYFKMCVHVHNYSKLPAITHPSRVNFIQESS